MIDTMFCFFAGSKPAPVKTAFVKTTAGPAKTPRFKSAFLRYCHL
jgi:hypothetical protein